MPKMKLAKHSSNAATTGQIPSGWRCASLGQLVHEEKPIVYGIVQAGPEVEDGVPYIKSGDVGARYVDATSLARTSEEIAATYSRSILSEGDIVFSLRGNIGETSLVPRGLNGANLTQGTARISVANTVSAEYVRFFLNSYGCRKNIGRAAKGSTFREITIDDLRKLQIILPEAKVEQEAIAGVVNAWAASAEHCESLIQKLKERKQGLMQQLLTGRRRLPGFADHVKPVPLSTLLTESREEGSSGDVAKKLTVKLYGRGVVSKDEIRAGSEATKYYRRRAGQFIYSKLDFLNGAFGLVPKSLDGYESTLDLPAFDIAITANPAWLLAYMTRSEFYEACFALGNGGRKAKRINPGEFKRILIKLPSLKEQAAIAAVLRDADEEIALEERRLAALREQKRGLMQKLLTGEVRVKS